MVSDILVCLFVCACFGVDLCEFVNILVFTPQLHVGSCVNYYTLFYLSFILSLFFSLSPSLPPLLHIPLYSLPFLTTPQRTHYTI